MMDSGCREWRRASRPSNSVRRALTGAASTLSPMPTRFKISSFPAAVPATRKSGREMCFPHFSMEINVRSENSSHRCVAGARCKDGGERRTPRRIKVNRIIQSFLVALAMFAVRRQSHRIQYRYILHAPEREDWQQPQFTQPTSASYSGFPPSGQIWGPDDLYRAKHESQILQIYPKMSLIGTYNHTHVS